VEKLEGRNNITWYCMDRVSSCNVYVVQQDTQCFSLWLSLFITFVSSTCFGTHRSIFRSVFYKLYVQIWHVIIRLLLDTSSRYGVLPTTPIRTYSL
jgi:hypothetical protein